MACSVEWLIVMILIAISRPILKGGVEQVTAWFDAASKTLVSRWLVTESAMCRGSD